MRRPHLNGALDGELGRWDEGLCQVTIMPPPPVHPSFLPYSEAVDNEDKLGKSVFVLFSLSFVDEYRTRDRATYTAWGVADASGA